MTRGKCSAVRVWRQRIIYSICYCLARLWAMMRWKRGNEKKGATAILSFFFWEVQNATVSIQESLRHTCLVSRCASLTSVGELEDIIERAEWLVCSAGFAAVVGALLTANCCRRRFVVVGELSSSMCYSRHNVKLWIVKQFNIPHTRSL